MFKLPPRAPAGSDNPSPVLSLSKDGPRTPTVVRQAHHGVGKSARGAFSVWHLLACLLLFAAFSSMLGRGGCQMLFASRLRSLNHCSERRRVFCPGG